MANPYETPPHNPSEVDEADKWKKVALLLKQRLNKMAGIVEEFKRNFQQQINLEVEKNEQIEKELEDARAKIQGLEQSLQEHKEEIQILHEQLAASKFQKNTTITETPPIQIQTKMGSPSESPPLVSDTKTPNDSTEQTKETLDLSLVEVDTLSAQDAPKSPVNVVRRGKIMKRKNSLLLLIEELASPLDDSKVQSPPHSQDLSGEVEATEDTSYNDTVEKQEQSPPNVLSPLTIDSSNGLDNNFSTLDSVSTHQLELVNQELEDITKMLSGEENVDGVPPQQRKAFRKKKGNPTLW